MSVMATDKEKNKDDEKNPNEKKQKNSTDHNADKGTTLAKRSGQRPALLFNRKKLPPPQEKEKKD
jgi:hypothetical protein